MIFCILFIKTIKSLTLNEESYEKIRSEDPETKLLIKLWDPWCDHCARFAPTWEAFISQTKIPINVMVADIDCQASQKLCLKLSRPGYPQILWISNDSPQPIRYEGPLNVDGLQVFLRKQINYPFVEADLNEIQKYTEYTNVSSIFVYEHPIGDQNFLLHHVILEFRMYDCIFLSVNSISEKLYVYRSKTQVFQFDQEWNFGNLQQFIMDNAFPMFPMLTAILFDLIKAQRRIIGLFFIEQSHYHSVYDTALKLSEKYWTTYSVYDEREWMAKFLNVKKLPTFFILDMDNSRWKEYPHAFNSSELIDWVQNLDLAKIKWEGPGNGLFSEFWTQIYQLRAAGQTWILGLVIFVIIFCVLMFWLMASCLDEEDTKEYQRLKAE